MIIFITRNLLEICIINALAMWLYPLSQSAPILIFNHLRSKWLFSGFLGLDRGAKIGFCQTTPGKLNWFVWSFFLMITPLCKGQATKVRYISSEGGRGGIPKSEFRDHSTIQILRKSWRHFTCKVNGKNSLFWHHYWIKTKNMWLLWVVVMLLFEWLSVRINVSVGNVTSFACDVTLPQPDKAFLGLFRGLIHITEQVDEEFLIAMGSVESCQVGLLKILWYQYLLMQNWQFQK